MLRYLAERGIRPGARLRITGAQPFGGPLFVEVEGREHALGGELAEKMRVQVERRGAAELGGQGRRRAEQSQDHRAELVGDDPGAVDLGARPGPLALL